MTMTTILPGILFGSLFLGIAGTVAIGLYSLWVQTRNWVRISKAEANLKIQKLLEEASQAQFNALQNQASAEDVRLTGMRVPAQEVQAFETAMRLSPSARQYLDSGLTVNRALPPM